MMIIWYDNIVIKRGVTSRVKFLLIFYILRNIFRGYLYLHVYILGDRSSSFYFFLLAEADLQKSHNPRQYEADNENTEGWAKMIQWKFLYFSLSLVSIILQGDDGPLPVCLFSLEVPAFVFWRNGELLTTNGL